MKEITEIKIRKLLAEARKNEMEYTGFDKVVRDSDSYIVDVLAPYFEDESVDNSLDNDGGTATI